MHVLISLIVYALSNAALVHLNRTMEYRFGIMLYSSCICFLVCLFLSSRRLVFQSNFIVAALSHMCYHYLNWIVVLKVGSTIDLHWFRLMDVPIASMRRGFKWEYLWIVAIVQFVELMQYDIAGRYEGMLLTILSLFAVTLRNIQLHDVNDINGALHFTMSWFVGELLGATFFWPHAAKFSYHLLVYAMIFSTQVAAICIMMQRWMENDYAQFKTMLRFATGTLVLLTLHYYKTTDLMQLDPLRIIQAGTLVLGLFIILPRKFPKVLHIAMAFWTVCVVLLLCTSTPNSTFVISPISVASGAPSGAHSTTLLSVKEIAIFSAAGNGNLGDNIQPVSWKGIIHSIPELRHIRVTSWSAEACCYSFFPESDKFMLQHGAIDNDDAIAHPWQRNSTMIWIGGGGLLSWPHWPLTEGQKVARFFAGSDAKLVWMSVGAELPFLINSSLPLLDRASFISVRDHISHAAMQQFIHHTPIAILSDPVLVDSTNFPVPLTLTRARRTCWILRAPISSGILQIIDAYYNKDTDLIFTLEAKDENFGNRFYPAQIRLYNSAYVLFYDNLIHECSFVVSMRYHGVILALRALKPVAYIGEFRKGSSIMEQMNLSHCIFHNSSAATMWWDKCKVNFDRNAIHNMLIQREEEMKRVIKHVLSY